MTEIKYPCPLSGKKCNALEAGIESMAKLQKAALEAGLKRQQEIFDEEKRELLGAFATMVYEICHLTCDTEDGLKNTSECNPECWMLANRKLLKKAKGETK